MARAFRIYRLSWQQHRLQSRQISHSLVRFSIDAALVDGVPSTASSSPSAMVSKTLDFYRIHHQTLPLSESVALLLKVEGLQPSKYDQRLLALVDQIAAQKDNLSLTAIVNVSHALQRLGLHKELPGLTALAVESASFLPSDVIISLAKTLALSLRQPHFAIDAKEYIVVFRILGEHLLEGMPDVDPDVLGEALLAVASFHCAKGRAGVHLTLSKAWLDDIFAPCAELLLARVSEFPAYALVKCLRAYKLVLLSKPRQTEMDGSDGLVETLPSAICGSLKLKLSELRAKSVVRSLHALAALSNHGVPISEAGKGFCTAAIQEILVRVKELDVRDISFAIKSVAILLQRELCCPAEVASLLQGLHIEIHHHVASLTLEDVLAVTRAFVSTAVVESPGAVLELMAAELLRQLRNLTPEQICDTIVAFSHLKFKPASVTDGLSLALTSQLSRFHPKQLALSLHGLIKMDVRDERMLLEVEKHIIASLISFHPRDMALSLWAFAKATHRNDNIFVAVQEEVKKHDPSTMSPADVSMLLWSISKADIEFNAETLSMLSHYVINNIRSFSVNAVIVTCLGFARLGFAQQPILIDLYRNMYGQLPLLTDAQLAFSFFLFSTSGIRDEPLVYRFVYESKCRLGKMWAQELSNVLLACSRTVAPTDLAGQHSMSEPLRTRIFELLEASHLPLTPLLGIYLSAPSLLEFTKEENLVLMAILEKRFEEMDASELVRCLVATVKLDFVHKPFLLQLFHYLRKKRGYITQSEVVSCIWAVHAMGFCKPKFRRSLAVVLLAHVRRRSIAPRALRDILPALAELGMWERLPASLRRSIWKIATEDLRIGVSPPPAKPVETKDELVPSSTSPAKWLKENSWRLTPLRPGLLRKGFSKNKGHAQKYGMALARKSTGWEAVGLKSLKVDTMELTRSEQKERKKMDAEAASLVGSKNAVQDFVDMIRRL